MKKLGNIRIQKKVMVFILAALVVLCGLATGIIIHRVQQAKIADTLNKANITWYSEQEETFTITTVKELYDLAVLSDFYNFEGQEILLDADLVVNEGNAADWATTPPEKMWFPIQGFAGTFDGKGHTISGLYGAGVGESMGLFSDTHSKCKIKNFKLVNSYFSSNGTQGVGAITSNGCGVFEKIYTDAIVATNRYYGGGIIGRVDSGTESSVLARSTKISNCWFDGEIRMTSGAARMAGGIIGAIQIGNVRMEHCLGSGIVNCSVEKEAYNAGGLVGSVGVYRGTNNNVTLNMEDCLQSGTVNTPYKTSVGSVIGNVYKGTTVNVKNSYTVKGELNPTDAISGSMIGDALGLNQNWLIGQEAYRWTELDFNKYWSAIPEKTPELKCFATATPINLEGVKKAYNMDWYDEEAKDYIIDSGEDLYGLAMLCNQNVTFESKRLKLANDIVVNEGKATDWAKGENVPTLEWIPIGGGGNKHRPFSGTFDGQGYTISGLYMKSDDYYMGFFGVLNKDGKSTVKNLRLVNSYFECTRTENLGSEVDGLGGVAGQGAGTLDTIYCDTILVSGTRNTGGLVGNQRQKDSSMKVTNCWYDGKITGTQWIGGIVGFVYNGVKFTDISDCMVTADLTSTMQGEKDASYVGGIAGRIANAKISSCLTTGTYVGKKVTYSIIGRNTTRKGQKITIEKCYSTVDTKAMYENGSGGDTIAITSSKLTNEELQGLNGFENTLLNFYIKGVKNDGKWVAVNGKLPQLKSFAKGKALNLKGIPRRYADYDISWYDKEKDTYTIKTVAQLHGVAALNNGDIGDVFRDKIIKLAKDITVNKGLATDWENGVNLPTYTWTPIGGGEQSDNHRPFRGTFDGQGHTISGLYIKSDGYYLGLFGVMPKEGMATVKSLKLTNSYFECTRTDALPSELEGLGSIVGQGAGTLDTIYSDVILKNATRNTGGLIGNLRHTDAPLSITNCWYDGKITGTQWIGGLLGFVNSGVAYANMTDCLMTADLTSTTDQKHSYMGGLAARAANGTFASCVVAGTLTGPGLVRGLVGMSVTKPTQSLVLAKCYNVTNVAAHYDAALQKPITSHVLHMSADEVKGSQGYVNTLLDYYDQANNKTGRWVLIENEIPELLSFSKAKYVADLGQFGHLLRPVLADTTWYSEDKTEFVICTAGELYGFASLCNAGNTFAGKTVKLGTDIKVNIGYATDWEQNKNIPNNVWIPIGGGPGSADVLPFAGTFDGQGHTISGLYFKSSGNYLGLFGILDTKGSSIIQNVNLTNSCFISTGTWTGVSTGLGGIAGSGAGKLDTVYSDAIIISNSANNAGGLVGTQRYSDLEVTNCWFDGKVTGTNATHLGGIIGQGTSYMDSSTVRNCLVTADVEGKNCIGAIYGSTYDATIDSCIVDGTLTSSGHKAGFIGRAYKAEGKTIEYDKCYNLTNSSEACKPVDVLALKVGHVGHFTDEKQLQGINAYTKTLLSFYDKNTKPDAQWVLVEEKLPELRSFSKVAYVDDLTACATLARPVIADATWYNDTDTEFTISTAGELYGLVQLSNEGKTFAGKTVKLGADIIVNNGKATNWERGENIPDTTWAPIGQTTPFAGTFDGQGHKISGLYFESSGNHLGLFGQLASDGSSVIQNLQLVNSCFVSTGTSTGQSTGMGSIAGQGAGKLDTIYSDAILVVKNNAYNIGGFVGTQRYDDLEVNNCWFAGKITATKSNYVGGIVGWQVKDATGSSVQNCLITAEAIAGSTCVGAICGATYDVAIDSCVANCTLTSSGHKAGFVGRAYAGNSGHEIALSKCYNVTNLSEAYTTGATITIPMKSVEHFADKEQLSGSKAYQKTLLSFYDKSTNADAKWVLITDKLPELRSFTQETYVDDLTEISKLARPVIADTSWYNDTDTEFTINYAGELLGLAQLTNEGKTFKGKTIKLGSDIVMNDGKATDWEIGENLPDTVWTPIGGGSNNTNLVFAGTFDGQGHTISGLYMKSNGNYLGLFGLLAADGSAVIQNLKLTNTYFENTGTGTGTSIGLGSIAGQGQGKFDTIYSDAILKSTAYNTGGIVGAHRYVTVTVNNCVYKGKITGTSYVGGILGSGYKAVTKADIQNCLVVADCTASGNGVGGICGGVYTANITSCVVSGQMNTSGHRAGIVGRIYEESGKTVEVNKCYYNTNKDNVHTISGNPTVYVKNVKHFADKAQLTGTNAYANTLLDFYDQNTNASAKWVLIADKLPELRSFTKEVYMQDLSSLSTVTRPTLEQ